MIGHVAPYEIKVDVALGLFNGLLHAFRGHDAPKFSGRIQQRNEAHVARTWKFLFEQDVADALADASNDVEISHDNVLFAEQPEKLLGSLLHQATRVEAIQG